jgi:hypothetical protein
VAGHPYYLHYVCDALLRVCNEEMRAQIFTGDVVRVVSEVLPELPGIRDEVRLLPGIGQTVLAAVAERTSFEVPRTTIDEVMAVLKGHNVQLKAADVAASLEQLTAMYVLRTSPGDTTRTVAFALPLVREHLRQRGVRDVALSNGLL